MFKEPDTQFWSLKGLIGSKYNKGRRGPTVGKDPVSKDVRSTKWVTVNCNRRAVTMGNNREAWRMKKKGGVFIVEIRGSRCNVFQLAN